MCLAIVTACTMFRVVAALVILVFLWPQQAWTAIFLLITFAFATDMFDGMLARHWHVVSWFGKIADPLADKIICLTVLWLVAGQASSWLVIFGAVLITVYDITTMTLRFSTSRAAKPVAAAHLVAKAKTVVLMSSLCLFVLDLMAGGQTLLFTAGLVLLALACGLAVWSLRQYLGQIFNKKETAA